MIVVDFEGTIYNEAKLRRDLRRVFGSFGLDFETVYRKTAKHGHFCLDCLKRTNLKKDKKNKIIAELRKLFSAGNVYIYDDAKKFLRKYSGKVSILSYGSSDLQGEKILGSGIAKFIKQIEITQLHKRESKELLSKATMYIDNDPEITKEIAKSYSKIKLYLIDREEKFKGISGNFTKIKSLTEVDNAESRGIKSKKQKNRTKV